jgi:hypothetical protein
VPSVGFRWLVFLLLLVGGCDYIGPHTRLDIAVGDRVDVEDTFPFYFQTGENTYIPVATAEFSRQLGQALESWITVEAVEPVLLTGATWSASEGIVLESTKLSITVASVIIYQGGQKKSAAGLKIIGKVTIRGTNTGDKRIWIKLPGLAVAAGILKAKPTFQEGWIFLPPDTLEFKQVTAYASGTVVAGKQVMLSVLALLGLVMLMVVIQLVKAWLQDLAER